MTIETIKEYWNKGPCPLAKQAMDMASRYTDFADEHEVYYDFFQAFNCGISSMSLVPSKIVKYISDDKKTRYQAQYKNFYQLGEDARADIKRNTFDATYEINDEWNVGIKNSQDPEKCTIWFLTKANKPCGYNYYASTLAEHQKDVGLYLDMGRDVKIDGKSMNDVVRIAKAYAGVPEEPDDYDDEAEIIRQIHADYDAGLIDDDEYERRLDFIM